MPLKTLKAVAAMPSIPIIGPPSCSLAVMQGHAKTLGATDWYQKALLALYAAGLRTGVDPAVLAGQCGQETGWGTFKPPPGRQAGTSPAHGNTAGIKIRDVPDGAADDDPDIHARFAVDPLGGYPWLGALAHAHHLMLYAGVPVPHDTPDPRAIRVWPGSARFGSARFVEQLGGGNWAPATDYGTRVAAAIRKVTTGA